MKILWALRYVFGMVLVFGLGVVFLANALWRYPIYVGIAVLLLVGSIVASQPRVRTEQERMRKLVDEAFRSAYGQLSPPPSIAIASSYGYPSFEIKFRSKLEKEAAAARNEIFTLEISRIFKGFGPRRRPFNAEAAIFFTHEGHLDELRAYHKSA